MTHRVTGAAIAVAALLLTASCSASREPAHPVNDPSAGQSTVAAATGTQPATADPSQAPSQSTTAARPGAIPAISGGPTGPAHADAPAATTSSPPVRVRIPSIGVDSRLQALGLAADGSLQTPSQWQVAGWYARGVRPGDTGPAVIAGHVDSVSGPAVFFKLRDLRPGSTVIVTRADHSTVRFTVARSDEYPKRKFPTEAVYGPTPVPTLRLVTCTGDFDYAKRSYVDNLVVTAYPA